MKLKPHISALLVFISVGLPNPGTSQVAGLADGMQQRLQAFQQIATQNEQQLRQYQWIETTTVTVKGKARPPQHLICRYTPSGSLSKTPLGSQQQSPQLSGGPFMRHIEEKKIAEAKKDVASVRELTGVYLPMNPSVLKQALQTRRIDLERQPNGESAVIINDYAKSGDKLSLEIDPATKKLRRITVRSYFTNTSEIFVASVDFVALRDGTTYPSFTRLEAPSKQLTISTVSSSFSKAIQ